jgi:myo-inositol-1(or 4)-monophosphatase
MRHPDGGGGVKAERGREKGSSDSALAQVIALVRDVARSEVTPRYLKVAHSRKADGSLFTVADAAAQQALESALPDIIASPVLGEEMSEAQQQAAWAAGENGLWCIDPIDGTSNFVAGIPYFAISVAYLENGRRRLGVVYDPVAGECFYAERGKGAFLDGVPLPIRTPVGELRRAMAGIEPKRLPKPLIARLVAEPPYASLRNLGASALDWCYVAAGRFDIYVHGNQKLWDYTAGALILEEGGGMLSCLEGAFDDGPVWERSVIASASPELFGLWRDWLIRAAG